MRKRKNLLLKGLLFVALAGVAVLYMRSFSQIPRRIEERIEIGTAVDTTAGVLLGWQQEYCCPEKSNDPCRDPNKPPWVPDTDNPVMPCSGQVFVKIISTSSAWPDEFWLLSPSPPILLWQDPRGHEGEEQVIGPYSEYDTLIFMIHSGICTS